MGATFLDDFSGDLFENTVINDLQFALLKAVRESPKSVVTAHYPRSNYESADGRLHIEVNLDAIRRNKNNTKAIKITADFILENGSYSSETEPDFAKIEMSYLQFCDLTLARFVREVLGPLIKRLEEWNSAHGIFDDPFNAFDGVPEPERPKESVEASNNAPKLERPKESVEISYNASEPERPKKQPALLKCEIELESMDESVIGETVLEPTRQELRAMYLKATTNRRKCKMHIRSTLSEKEYDSLETGVEETGLIYVSLIKDGVVEKTKSANTTVVAYRIINEYLEKGTVADMDAIEQEVLSAPPKPQKKQPVQNNSSPAGGCLGVGILIVIGVILIYNLIQLILIL